MHQVRVFLVFLTLIAAVAFQTRVGGLNAFWQLAFPNASFVTTWCGPQDIDPSVVPVNPYLKTSPQQAPEHSDHQAHCSFCVSNAFSLEAVPLALPPAPFADQELLKASTPDLQRRTLDDLRARAPPSILDGSNFKLLSL